MNFIDRRLNPGGKSLPNRQRFLRVAKAAIKDQVVRSIRDRGLSDAAAPQVVKIPMRRIAEPRFRHAASGGDRDQVFPGNKEYVAGDKLPKPKGGQGQGGREGSPDGEGEDDFAFTLTSEEYLDILFEELELPDLAKRKLKQMEINRPQRAGYSVSGSPTNLNVVRTMRSSLARRISLGRPKPGEVEALAEMISDLEHAEAMGALVGDRLVELRERLRGLEARAKRIAYIDPVDLRYNRFEATPKPQAQAVMFCLMDVSGSMTEDMKDLAKRFFLLLHIFLNRKYKHVDVVFIRHTTEAREVDEETFFHSRETGGTIVSSALAEMRSIIEARYPVDEWNIYAAQASDGDNYASDSRACLEMLTQQILPVCQYFAYVEVYDSRQAEIFHSSLNVSDLWKDYLTVPPAFANFAMKRVFSKEDVYPVFHQLFSEHREAA